MTLEQGHWSLHLALRTEIGEQQLLRLLQVGPVGLKLLFQAIVAPDCLFLMTGLSAEACKQHLQPPKGVLYCSD